MMAGEAPMAADAGDDDGDDDGDDAEGAGEVEGGEPGQQQPAAFGENGDGRKRRRRRGRRGRRGRREDGGTPYQSEPQSSPLGHLPTPAEALDAPDWPATGGFDTRVGAPPPARSFDAPRREQTVEAPAMASAPPTEEPKQERSGIASFLFGPKAEEGDSGSESKPQRKGWWQRKTDA